MAIDCEGILDYKEKINDVCTLYFKEVSYDAFYFDFGGPFVDFSPCSGWRDLRFLVPEREREY
ncbi:MAG: hypothetical protein ACK42H_04540, partial [Planctomycetota bacterium]